MLCQEIDFATYLSIEKIVIDLPPIEKCKSIDNFARILNKYLDDITVMQKFIINVRLPSDEEEAEKIFERYLELK